MIVAIIACARCTNGNQSSSRFCLHCGLPLGAVQPDIDAGSEALGPYEAPEPADPDVDRSLRDLVIRSGFESGPSGHGWRIVVPLGLDRKQAVYAGYAGIDPSRQPVLSLVSVCGPANERDPRILLKLNARMIEGHFAIKLLRGEEYFVVIQNLWAESVGKLDSRSLIGRIAETADDLEDRLLRGRDMY